MYLTLYTCNLNLKSLIPSQYLLKSIHNYIRDCIAKGELVYRQTRLFYYQYIFNSIHIYVDTYMVTYIYIHNMCMYQRCVYPHVQYIFKYIQYILFIYTHLQVDTHIVLISVYKTYIYIYASVYCTYNCIISH